MFYLSIIGVEDFHPFLLLTDFSTCLQTRPATSLIDGVGIIAILQKSTGPELLLQKQFRPPVAKVCIEVPAGLVDAGESAEEAAIRELREETGYIGTVEESLGGGSGILFNGESTSTSLYIDIMSDGEAKEKCSADLACR